MCSLFSFHEINVRNTSSNKTSAKRTSTFTVNAISGVCIFLMGKQVSFLSYCQRNKRKTHVKQASEQEKLGADPNKSKVPKSFVIRSGKIGRSAFDLVGNIRKVMEPHTASRLKVSFISF